MSVEQRLLNFRLIDQHNGCWLFTGYRNSDGYGKMGIGGSAESVHRIAAMLWLDYEPGDTTSDGDELCVLHIHRGNRHCFNPEHLYIGTKKQNSADRVHHGTAFNHWNAKLTDDQVREILYKIGSVPLRQLARDYNVDYGVIAAIKAGRTWKHIERV